MSTTSIDTRARKPAAVAIKVRRMDYDVGSDVPRYWLDGDPFLTHFMNALSITFPPGERMFMDAVRAVRREVTGPETQREISLFLGQEALHSRAHEGLNAHLSSLGYPVERLEAQVAALLARHKRRGGKRGYLTVTCALEHVTAMLGHRILSRPAVQAVFHESVRPMWLWHALEETEHKGVAFDVYQEVYGSYLPRAAGMIVGTVGLFVMVPYLMAVLLHHDGLLWKPGLWAKGAWRLWGPKGLLSGLWPVWLSYFRRDFHPWQHDNSQLIAAWEHKLMPA